jgi:hypothetical protein
MIEQETYNIETAYRDYAKSIGKTVKKLTRMEKKKALINHVLDVGATKEAETYWDSLKTKRNG